MSRRLIPAAALLLGGCAAGTAYAPPQLPVAGAWKQAASMPRPAERAWWSSFGDPVLDRLVARALAGNPDIDVALARVEQSRAAAGLARAAALPSATVSGTAARSQQSLEEGLGRLSRYVPGFGRTQNRIDLGLNLSWDLDFAGGLARQNEAARADLVAAAAGTDAARLAVAAEVADTYLGLRAAEEQLALLAQRRTLVVERHAIMGRRVARGEAAANALEEPTAMLAALDAALPAAHGAVQVAKGRLAILVGEPASTDLPELAAGGAVPQAGDPAAGVPADLLRARPDLVVAEARLRAAHARVGQALGEYWPKLSLAGLLGFSSNTLSTFGSGDSSVIQGGVGLRWRLFDFGRVDAEIARARGQEHEALATYRGQVLKAGEQVESAFIQLAAARSALVQRQAQEAALARAATRAAAAFRVGEISRDQLRAVETVRLDGADAVLDARLDAARAVLACHRALGG
ncbi:TolC family protein [Novosphingobium sp. KCTC 2891]|uniref:efflux transporter outer membrane subunit n=1 Tax=Novosphingobium sp. KCTC 2891 TaxID=2989730 RepID=UPI002221EE02|nr:TolC family protein [Novosphingobium sp. KCTC 2891]MCW1383131.1 TolC family protein [Novosphingobium sp. KCTC 2891]